MRKTRYIICEECGKKVRDCFNANSSVYQKMIAESLCYECAYWKNIIENWKDTYYVIDGICYDFQPFHDGNEANIMLGSNGKNYYALTTECHAIHSNDVWVKGTVPERFRDILKDSAYHITGDAYNILSNGCHICKNKGCYDRYHCFFYDYRNEYGIGPYNVIPRNWVAGNEHCKSFIDIRKIKGLNIIVDSEHFLDIMKQQESEKVHLSKKGAC